jgi:hypothetical protein
MPLKTATEASELDVVELRNRVDQYESGTRGTIVSADRAAPKVTVEFEDAQGDVDLVTVDRLDLILVQRISQVPARGEQNGH